MPFITYGPIDSNEAQFVEFWRHVYAYEGEHLYADNIGKELTEERVFDLFLWKNGTPLSERKHNSVLVNFSNRLEDLEGLQPNTGADEFLSRFSGGGAIWRIFWLHCWKPESFPIYDQHVHRAMEFILNGVPQEIPAYGPRKIVSYIDRYLPFHERFEGLESREVDKALWAFGKFLKEGNFPLTLNDPS